MSFCRNGLLVLKSGTISGDGLGSLVMPEPEPDIDEKCLDALRYYGKYN